MAEPSPISAAAYDIIWTAATAENAARLDSGSSGSRILATESQTVENLKDTIMETARSYIGVTGNTTLNKMGDRVECNYDFWKVEALKSGVGNEAPEGNKLGTSLRRI